METLKIIKSIRAKVKKLQTLPEIATRLISVINEDDHSAKDIVNIIETDTALTTRILNIANSASFYRGSPILTLRRAITHLGENMVVGIALGSCASSLLARPLEGYIAAAGELWDHSLLTAISAKKLSRVARVRVPADLAYTAGLLHDIGKIVFSELIKEYTSKVIEYCRKFEGKDHLDAEREIVGIDHADAGIIVAKEWKLPSPLPEVIGYHHRPSQYTGDNIHLVFIVHLADISAMMIGAGTGLDSMSYKMDEKCTDYIDIGKKEFTALYLDVHEEFIAIKNTLFNKLETS